MIYLKLGTLKLKIMKIALNATCLNNRPSGAKKRFTGIYEQVFSQCTKYDFIVFEPKDFNVSSWFTPHPNVQYIKTDQSSENSLQRYLRGKLFWNAALRKIKPDIFESFHQPLVKSPIGRTITTVHDIRYLRFSALYSPYRRLLARLCLRSALERADVVITVSDSMKGEILDFFPKANVRVLYNGINIESFHKLTDEDIICVRSKYDIPPNFLLCVGHFEKRKNYLRLLDALDLINKEGNNLSLVIVGNYGDDLELVYHKINQLGLSGSVKILMNLSDNELHCLYRLSSLFVFPSIYEGFGIPILEAMAARCPMVISNLPVFREITENQFFYFDPYDPVSIADHILKVYNSKEEQNRITDYGIKRLKMFSYKKIAQDLNYIYSGNIAPS